MARLNDIAQAVAGVINTANLHPHLTASVDWVPKTELQALSSHPMVRVTPAGRADEPATRESNEVTYQVNVAVLARLLGTGLAEMLSLAEDIADYLAHRPLPGLDGCYWSGIEIDSPYSIQMIEEKNAFVSVMTVSYKVMIGPLPFEPDPAPEPDPEPIPEGSLTVSGTLFPDIAGVFSPTGDTRNGEPVYEGPDGFALWYSAGLPVAWIISTAAGTLTGPHWARLAAEPEGTYDPAGGATGTATVTAPAPGS